MVKLGGIRMSTNELNDLIKSKGLDISDFKINIPKIQPTLDLDPIHETMRQQDQIIQMIADANREKLEREKQVVNNSNENLKLQKRQTQLHELELEFMKNIDGNTQAVVEQLNSLILSAHVDEIYQANILNTLRDIKEGESYWEIAKKAVMEATIQQGVSAGFAVMAMAFKQSVLNK